tara:strand:+ start:3564 stop:5486 length:1923 start_codon:yes stop_codon:yes gene_type:complete
MATERRDIALSIIADTKRYQQELAKLPRMTDEAASKAAVMAIKQQIREENEKARIRKKAIADRLREETKAERDRVRVAERANKEIEGSYRDQFGAIKGLSGAAFGGVAGDVFDLVEVLTGVGKGMAVVGAGLAALSIAPELIRGVHEFADGARESAKALGHTFTSEQVSRVGAFEASTRQFEDALNELKMESQILVGSGLTPMIQAMAQVLSGINNILDSDPVHYFSELVDAVGDSKDQFLEMLGPIDDVAMAILRIPEAPLRLLMAFGDAQADFSPMAAEILKVSDAMEDTGETAKKTGKVYHDEAKSIEQIFDDRAKAISAQQKMEQEALADIEAARNEEARQDRARYQARIQLGKDATASAIADMEAEAEAERQVQLLQAENHQRAMAREEEAKRQREERREELEQEMLALADLQGIAVGAAASFADLKFQATREGAEDATNKADKLKQEIEQLKGTIKDANAEERREIQQTIRDKEDELAIAEVEAKQARRLARKQFKETKGLRISEAIINGAAAAVRALAELGPVAGAIAAAGIATTTAVQVATIRAQKPPKFHMGGMIEPDEQISVLRRGEAVLNERAAQRLGRQTIESLNRDEPLGNVNIYLGEDLLRSQRLQRTLRSGAHSAVGARSPYIGR